MRSKPSPTPTPHTFAAATPAGDTEPTPLTPQEESIPPALARRAVEAYVLGGRMPEATAAAAAPLLLDPAACFVCLKTAEGGLRGCIGTVEPAWQTLAEEIIRNAVGAATRDPRFPPVAADELPRLNYTVDVLGRPEPAALEDLDPAEYGVIVEDNIGRRRGLLLPAIEGVESALEQVRIAARKAGIAAGEPLQLYRFRVRRFREAV